MYRQRVVSIFFMKFLAIKHFSQNDSYSFNVLKCFSTLTRRIFKGEIPNSDNVWLESATALQWAVILVCRYSSPLLSSTYPAEVLGMCTRLPSMKLAARKLDAWILFGPSGVCVGPHSECTACASSRCTLTQTRASLAARGQKHFLICHCQASILIWYVRQQKPLIANISTFQELIAAALFVARQPLFRSASGDLNVFCKPESWWKNKILLLRVKRENHKICFMQNPHWTEPMLLVWLFSLTSQACECEFYEGVCAHHMSGWVQCVCIPAAPVASWNLWSFHFGA